MLWPYDPWNSRDTESFAYTEVNDTAAIGGDMAGGYWHRPVDRVAVVSNGLSAPHCEYLALGSLGFLLGAGGFRYGREKIIETYYTAYLWRGLSVSGGLQYIDHPGYNRESRAGRRGDAPAAYGLLSPATNSETPGDSLRPLASS